MVERSLWWWWDHRRTFVAKARVVVTEAATSAADSYTTGFTPEAGAIMGAPAGFVIMVSPGCIHIDILTHPAHQQHHDLASKLLTQ